MRVAMDRSARRLSVDILVRVCLRGDTVDQALEHVSICGAYGLLDASDRRFCYNLVMLSVRHYDRVVGFLDWLAGREVHFKRSDRVFFVLVISLVQLCLLDTPIYAVISEAHKLLRRPSELGFKGFVNAILQKAGRHSGDFANCPHNQIQNQIQHHARMNGWRLRWRQHFGDGRGDNLWRVIYDSPPLDLVFKDIVGRDKFKEAFEGMGEIIVETPTRLRLKTAILVEALPFYADGDWWVQDMAAGLAVEFLGVQAGMRILDLCAAPGGKTAQILNRVSGCGGKVVAVDKSPDKVSLLRRNLERLRFSCEIVCADLLDYSTAEPFDLILLDAPCSASGTLRHNPEFPLIKSPDVVAAMAEQQFTLLDYAYTTLLGAGGRLLYSVCSLEAEEGEAVLGRLLALREEACVVALDSSRTAVPTVRGSDDSLRTYPDMWQDKGGLDGFYMALISKGGYGA